MKKLAILIAVAAVFVLGVGVSVAAADKPPSPPGQGPCEHGNSQKPCKDDPQPDHGAECKEHGQKGGVNEDHCKDETTPTETTPTETTPTETTPTTPEETTPSTPTETTPTQPETPDGGIQQPPAVTPPTTAPADGSSVTPPALEKELEEQAAQNGASNVPSSHVASTEELPYTGLSLWWAVALGTGLVGTGLWLRRKGQA